jgi:hypothetical protein
MMRCRLLIGLLVFPALVTLGCAKDPFSTRRPSRPTGEQGTYRTPVDPQIALDTNLYYAMNERNATHYSSTLAESLIFIFDYTLAGPPDSSLSWDAAEENRIARNLFAGAPALAATWWPTPGRTDRYEDSLAILYRTYEITASISEQGGIIQYEFRGEMVVHLARNPQDLWWIVRWEDLHKGDGTSSWADLKSRFR